MPIPECVALTRYFYKPEERSDRELHEQLRRAGAVVDHRVTRPLLPYQRDALVCLVSDLLSGYAEAPSIDFDHSFLLLAVNKGMFQIAAAEFHMFCYAKGKVQTQCWEKRRAEQYLFSQGRLLF